MKSHVYEDRIRCCDNYTLYPTIGAVNRSSVADVVNLSQSAGLC